ncbi:DMT family transporter [Lysinibacillus irui]|uniref:DMT family transporter n=1 Tax=Lysinibacillus irui TaxID=2998077 RepID=A0ABU5NK51_9BACI|nr:DMT family transporter [Lysinibacillus irui]MEA0554568.1 DMT family transporter [Lysinibacillus irui]MEA0976410.1 DMT family transporter [Lysinibacillus irui]MEA1042564.1 DMT family transporter [Lysinibacillus irui]
MSGKLAFVLSMVIFGAVGVFARYIPLASSEIAFWMSGIGACFLLVIFIYKKESFARSAIVLNKWPLLISSVALCGNWIFLFQAYKETTIANAALSYYFAPVLVICLSPIILKEKLVARKIVYVGVALIGLFLIVQSQNVENSGHLIGIVYGLIAACFYTVLTFTNKNIRGLKEPHNTIIQLCLAAFFLSLYIVGTTGFQVMQINFASILLLIVLGIVHAGIGFYLFFLGMSQLKGQSIAILSYIDPLTSLVISTMIIGEKMTLLQLIGAILLLGSTLQSEIEKV